MLLVGYDIFVSVAIPGHLYYFARLVSFLFCPFSFLEIQFGLHNTLMTLEDRKYETLGDLCLRYR